MVYSEALPELRPAGNQDKMCLTGNNGLVFPWRGWFILNYQGSVKEIFTTQPSLSQKPVMCTYHVKIKLLCISKANCNILLDFNARTKCHSDQKFLNKP